MIRADGVEAQPLPIVTNVSSFSPPYDADLPISETRETPGRTNYVSGASGQLRRCVP